MFDELTLDELLVLQRAVLEAKFNLPGTDEALKGSPVLAGISLAIVAAIVERYEAQNDSARADEWRRWSRWESRTAEQRAVREYLRLSRRWAAMTSDQRDLYVRSLIAPFEARPDEITQLIDE